MLKFILEENLAFHTDLARQAAPYSNRKIGRHHGWTTHTARAELGKDGLDRLGSIYIIHCDDQGGYLSSAQMLPISRQASPLNQPSHLWNHPLVAESETWQFTDFRFGSETESKSVSQLLAAGARMMRELSIMKLLFTYDTSKTSSGGLSGAALDMTRLVLKPEEQSCVALWQYSIEAYQRLLRLADLDAIELELDVANSDICNNFADNGAN